MHAQQGRASGSLISIALLAAVLVAASASAQSMKFTYDAAGNLVERVVTSGTAPQIIRQPRPNVVSPGSGASFAVVVSDTRGLSYQWKLGGVAITGATSDILYIPSAGTSDVGNYFTQRTSITALECGSAATLSTATAG